MHTAAADAHFARRRYAELSAAYIDSFAASYARYFTIAIIDY